MRKLPYNKGQNPMEVAESFCARESIHKGNTDQIRQFIIQNAGVDTGAPAQAAAPSSKPPEPASSVFPVMTYLNFKEGKFEPLKGKILEFNGQVDSAQKMDEIEVGFLTALIGRLEKSLTTAEFRPCEKEVVFVKLRAWPSDKIFPVIDLWRIFMCHSDSSGYFKGSDRGTTFITQVLGYLAAEPSSGLGLCSARFLANLFIYQTNRYAIFDKRELVLKGIEPVLAATTNKHVKVALTTLLLNFAICLHESSQPPKPWDKDAAALVVRLTLAFLEKAGADDVDAVKRALLTIGTLLPRDQQNGAAVAGSCKAAGLPAKLGGLEAKAGANVVAELRKLLG
jgi:phospholipase A-2-activating protein